VSLTNRWINLMVEIGPEIQGIQRLRKLFGLPWIDHTSLFNFSRATSASSWLVYRNRKIHTFTSVIFHAESHEKHLHTF